MKINWKARLKNKAFLTALFALIVLFVEMVGSLFGIDVIKFSQQATLFFNSLLGILVMLGIVVIHQVTAFQIKRRKNNMSITISPGIGKLEQERDLLDEVTEARKVVNRVIEILRASSITVNHVEDNTSTSQQQNLAYLVKQHNATNRKLDVSIHFNSATRSKEGKGTEVCYYDEGKLAAKLSSTIATAGKLRDRGAKQRKELAFLNGTDKPAILIEVCFVSSEYDAKMYKQNFEAICQAIAKELVCFVGKTLNRSVNINMENEKEITKVVTVTLLNETGRKEVRELLKKARKAGIIDATYHTDARINKYNDLELISYQAAVINREFK